VGSPLLHNPPQGLTAFAPPASGLVDFSFFAAPPSSMNNSRKFGSTICTPTVKAVYIGQVL
jgi:hypothetical protein